MQNLVAKRAQEIDQWLQHVIFVWEKECPLGVRTVWRNPMSFSLAFSKIDAVDNSDGCSRLGLPRSKRLCTMYVDVS